MTSFRTVLSIVATLAAVPAQSPEEITPLPEGAPAGMAAIDKAGLIAHAFKLASEEFGGRYTGSAGQLAAAEYIRDQLESFGLEPIGDGDAEGKPTWFQAWPVDETALDPDATDLTIGGLVFKTGFGVLPGSRVDEVDADGRFVFCRYGAPDDLPEEVAGRIPVVLMRTRDRSGQPVEAQFMLGLRTFSKCRAIASKLVRNGAQCVLFLERNDNSGVGEMLDYAGLLPGKPLLRYGNDSGMAAMAQNLRTPAPMVFLSSRVAAALLDDLGVEVSEHGELSDDEPGNPAGRVRIRVVRDASAHAVNVVGVLRGADPDLSREAVVYSAHMDHMGTRMDGDAFNGADDNASGTAAFLEVAQAFASGERPRRSVVFLAVSGEELGLWGSHWFSENPTWPLRDIVANVNIDMIGRADSELSDEREISITPSYRHDKYSSIARGAARLGEKVGLDLTIGDKFYTRSDHYNFARKGVPVVFFCDGEHVDYHQVTDTPDKLDYGKMERVTRLAYWIGDVVANESERPREIGRQRGWLGDR